MRSLFPDSYEASRERFLMDTRRIAALWPYTRLESHPLRNFPQLSIDWLCAIPRRKETLVVISTGQHGIEGYVGSAMLKIFMDEFAPRLNPKTTGLLLIHAINPWGMKHRLRVNPSHVDLNRNFIHNSVYDPIINPDFQLLTHFLNPNRPVRTLIAERIPFLFNLIKYMIRPGRKRVQLAALLGQHCNPNGIYYGGTQAEEESLVLMELYRTALWEYPNFLQLDMHTGYGPRNQMTILLSPFEGLNSADAAQLFGYPLVQKMNRDEFYEINGDMGDYIYRLRDAEFQVRNVFTGGFEFGTYGDSLQALIRSLQVTILENQNRHYGSTSPEAARQVLSEYRELFMPDEARWREKAAADCRQAYEGIFSAFKLLS